MTTENEELKTPSEWEEEMNIRVIDPDGWDRHNFQEDWARPLTKGDFLRKMSCSTIYHGMHDV